jgi:hypothetical protein
VGEPTGGAPNMYGDATQHTMPNSGLKVYLSTRYWEFGRPDDDRQAVEPDIRVEMTGSSYFAGRDPVLQAILD